MVTATSNLLIASILRKGVTYIHSAAYEPSVITLIHFLQKQGVQIIAGYDHTIEITGVSELPSHANFTNDYDYLESGTYIIAATLAAKNFLDIKHACISEHARFLQLLSRMGISTETLPNDTLRVHRAKKIYPIQLQTNIFPGITSDLQSPL
jgi:UDP-N-acetylglucosamine 1-carboxyvinyltransferase